jgi:excisionase family DNA binding protein
MSKYDIDEMITLKEARELLKIGRNTMYKLVRLGQIPARKVGAEWRIVKRNLIEWMNSSENSPSGLN